GPTTAEAVKLRDRVRDSNSRGDRHDILPFLVGPASLDRAGAGETPLIVSIRLNAQASGRASRPS
ncbi:hypothetical protein ACYOEI_08005, partial [Singulisphaera rosea]